MTAASLPHEVSSFQLDPSGQEPAGLGRALSDPQKRCLVQILGQVEPLRTGELQRAAQAASHLTVPRETLLLRLMDLISPGIVDRDYDVYSLTPLGQSVSREPAVNPSTDGSSTKERKSHVPLRHRDRGLDR